MIQDNNQLKQLTNLILKILHKFANSIILDKEKSLNNYTNFLSFLDIFM